MMDILQVVAWIITILMVTRQEPKKNIYSNMAGIVEDVLRVIRLMILEAPPII